MEHLTGPAAESFLLSETSKGSPELVSSPVSPTKSVRTNVQSLDEQQDPTFRTVDNLDSPDSSLVSMSAATDGSTRAIKSPGLARCISTEMPEYISSSIATTAGRQGELSARSPFVPKFLQLTGDGRGYQGATEVPMSFFDDSDSDLDQDAMVAGAQRGRVDRPQIIEHRSSRRVNLAHNLQLPTTNGDFDNRTGPSMSKAQEILGTQVVKSRDYKLAGDRGIERVRQAPAPASQPIGQSAIDTEELENPAGLGIRLHSKRDSLTSTPVHRASSVPPRRKVTFPPPPINVKPGHRFLRQSIISTPYPFRERTAKSKLSVSSATVRDSVITLCLYSNNSPVPKLSRIVIPADRVSGLVTDSSEKKRHNSRRDFDDEKLFQLIRTEYTKMRSPFHRYGSFRGLRSFNISSYKDLSHAASRWQNLTQTKSFSLADEGYDSESMLRLYLRPQLGKGQHRWVNWILGFSGRLNGGRISGEGETLVMEYVEGWCVAKIVGAVASVVLLSILATLLWVFVGVGSQLPGTEVSMGFRDAGGRVETGVALGAFVLLLGWTGVGAWVALSWLVM